MMFQELFLKPLLILFFNCIIILTGYRLDNWMIRVRFLMGSGNFSLQHDVQTSSGAHPASYSIGTRGSFPGGKMARL
jgi:hypothetical protein